MDETVEPKKLNNRQKVFVEEYLTCFNASEAARRAGYNGESNRIGSRLLTYVDIQRAIHERMCELAMQADEVLFRLREEASLNISDFIIEQPKRMTVGKGDDAEEYWIESASLDWEKVRSRGYLLKKISFNQYGPVIEGYDAQNAKALIGKSLGLFVDRSESKGDLALKVLIEYANSPYNTPEVSPEPGGNTP